jgi:L-gulonolactone oxidase
MTLDTSLSPASGVNPVALETDAAPVAHQTDTKAASAQMSSDTSFRATDRIVSWGRVVRAEHRAARPAFADELPALVKRFTPSEPGLAIGLRRSYGDSNLNPDGRVIDMTGLDRMIAFDPSTGLLRAEAGVSLSQCLQVLVPHGWFLPTTPGTRFVTLGGAVANDVHGKNHHANGTFGASVTAIGLRRTDGGSLTYRANEPMFHATLGGLGLTGVIEWVEFQAVRIPSTLLDAEDTAFANVDGYFDLMEEKKQWYEHTMAWVDCLAGGASLGRGVLSCANWAREGGFEPHREDPKLKMPMDAPGFALNSLSVKAFNSLLTSLKAVSAKRYRPHYEPFLYPLDAIANWNRLYGSRGFYQYQSVIPPETARDATKEMLTRIAKSGQGSFLAVLKDFGSQESLGMLSFPKPGTTLALDFPNKGAKTLKLMGELDAVVKEAGGRLYPAKDGRIPKEMFEAGFPKLQDFRAYVDPGLSSGFWRRVSQ